MSLEFSQGVGSLSDLLGLDFNSLSEISARLGQGTSFCTIFIPVWFSGNIVLSLVGQWFLSF